MLVFEIITMFVQEDSQYFELWDNEKEEIVFKGYLSDLTEKLAWATVTSIDNVNGNTNGITLNIDIDGEFYED